MFGRSQQMRVVGINNAKARLGRRRQMDGVGRTQKYGCRQFLIDLPDTRKNVPVLRQPMKRSGLDVRLYLGDKGAIGGGPDGPFPQFAMECGDHFGLAMDRARHVVGCCERANSLGARILVIKPDEVAGIEVDHRTWPSRSSLMVSVESVPPRRCLRWARKARVNLGLAKNGLAGTGDAGTILAISCPRSVT